MTERTLRNSGMERQTLDFSHSLVIRILSFVIAGHEAPLAILGHGFYFAPSNGPI